MIIYSDIIAGDELLSDAYDIKLVDDVVYEVDSAQITIKPGADVDIGANPSAEDGGDEALEEGMITVNNVAYSFRLSETSFDKKSYITYIKGYMKRIKAKLAETDPEAVSSSRRVPLPTSRRLLPTSRTTSSLPVSPWTPMEWSFSSTTVRTVPPPTLFTGSTVSPRSRFKGNIL